MHAFRLAAAAAATLSLLPAAAAAIPAFARRYGVSCQLCHAPAPKLTAFGEIFAGNGFRFAGAEPSRDTVDTGDPLRDLARSLPLALRVDAYVRAYTEGPPPTSRRRTASRSCPAGRSGPSCRTTSTSSCTSAGRWAASRTRSST